jgi:hypothetical protein
VPKILDFGQPQKPGTALDGVRSAKDLVDQLHIDICARLLNGQQVVLDIPEVFGGFFHVHLESFVIHHHCANSM